jgi:hypothetical protein
VEIYVTDDRLGGYFRRYQLALRMVSHGARTQGRATRWLTVQRYRTSQLGRHESRQAQRLRIERRRRSTLERPMPRADQTIRELRGRVLPHVQGLLDGTFVFKKQLD